MALFQVPITIEQVTKIGQQLPSSIPNEYLPPILVFSAVFFLLSIIKFNLKLRIIVGVVVAVLLVGVNLLPANISSQISKFISPILSLAENMAKSLGMQGTLIASGALVFLGIILGKLSGKILFRKIMKKAGEPTKGMENKLKSLENQRDHSITELKHAKGDPVAELKIEKKINKINEKINVLKAKLGLPITA